jgi:hypothetical protein
MVLKINKLKIGSWLVTVKTQVGEGCENSWKFQCNGQAPTFELHYSLNGVQDGDFYENSIVKAWLEALPNGELLFTVSLRFLT